MSWCNILLDHQESNFAMNLLQDFEYNMSVKKTEIHSLQSEFDTLSATLKQLTSQRDVAQKRLDALDEQVGRI